MKNINEWIEVSVPNCELADTEVVLPNVGTRCIASAANDCPRYSPELISDAIHRVPTGRIIVRHIVNAGMTVHVLF